MSQDKSSCEGDYLIQGDQLTKNSQKKVTEVNFLTICLFMKDNLEYITFNT